MGLLDDFDDRKICLDAEKHPYQPYEYQTDDNPSWAGALPVKQGLYDPAYEKDACGVGFAWSVSLRPGRQRLPPDPVVAATSRASRATRSSAMPATFCAT